MKKEKFLLPKKITILFLFIFSLTYNISFSQCTNPTPTGAASQIFCKSDNKTVGDIVASGGTIVWYDAPSGGELYSTTEVLVNGITYYADDISGNNCSTSRLAVTVTIYGDFPTNVDVSVGKCAIDNPTVSNLSATGENIAWYDAQTDGNFLPLSTLLENGKTYWVQQTENGCTSARFPTLVSLIDPITPTAAPIQSFCSPPNPTVANLRATGTTILWYDSEISTTPLKSTTLLIDGEDYWAAEVTFPCVSSNRAQTTVVLDEAPDAGVSSSFQECEVNIVTTNLFNLLGGTPDTTGIWTGPSTLSNGYLGTFEPGINTVGTYTYTVSSILGICPPVSATISVNIIIVSPPTVTETTQSFCVNESFTPTVGDLIPNGSDIRWYGSETDSMPIDPSVNLIDGNEYWSAQFDATSSCESATRIKATVVFDTTPIAGTNGSYTECEANLVATNLFGLLGGNPDTTGVWTGPSALSNGYLGTFEPGTNVEGTYTYSVSSSLGICPVASATVTVTINVVPPPTITETVQSFCINESFTPTVGDLIPNGSDIRWYGSETDTMPIDPSVNLIDGNEYWSAQFDATSSCESATRIKATVVFDTTPIAGTNGSYTECEANLVATNLFGLLGGNPDTTGVWTGPSALSNGYLGTFEPGTNVEGTYTYSVSSSLGVCPVASANVTVTINVVPPPTVTETTQSFCKSQNALVSDLTPNNANVIWYNSNGDIVTFNMPLENGIYSAAQTQEFGALTCESVNRSNVTVIINNPITPTGNQDQFFCKADYPTVSSLQAETSNANYTLSWYIDDVAATPLLPNEPLVNGTTYYASEVASLECESNLRFAVLVTLNDVAPATISEVSQTFCESDFPTISNLAATGNGILWYATQTSSAPLADSTPLVNGVAYWAAQTNATTGCVSSVRVVANVTLTTIATPTLLTLGNEFCKIDNPILADLNLNVSANNGGTISWYDAFPNGNLLNASAPLVEGETYYAIETNVNGCKSNNPLEVTVTLEACDAYDVIIYDGFSPTGNGVNDTFKITNLRELYPDFKVEFFNRWGNLIYTANAGKPDWNGRLHGDGELSPAGVYFFIVYFNKNDRKPMQRSLYLSR